MNSNKQKNKIEVLTFEEFEELEEKEGEGFFELHPIDQEDDKLTSFNLKSPSALYSPTGSNNLMLDLNDMPAKPFKYENFLDEDGYPKQIQGTENIPQHFTREELKALDEKRKREVQEKIAANKERKRLKSLAKE